MSNHEYSNPERYNGEMERYAKQMENELNNSAVIVNWGNVQGTLSAQTDLQTALNSKADLNTTNTALGTKADTTTVNTQLATKTDKTYVDNADSLKADKTYVDTQLTNKVDTSTFNTTVNAKVDTTTYNTGMSGKFDKVGGTLSGDLNLINHSLLMDNASIIQHKDLTGTYQPTIHRGVDDNVYINSNSKGRTVILGGLNANNIIENGTLLTSKYLPQTGGTLTGGLTGTTINATTITGTTINGTTLQEGGTNLSSKYAPFYSADIPFTNITLQNGATVNNARTPRYARRNGVVYLEGEISNIANTTIIGTLPAGCRPSYALNFICAMSKSSAIEQCLISVGSNGTITIIFQTVGATSAHVLNNIQFIAEL